VKTILQTLLLIGFITMNGQIDPVLDHTWTIEKIVTEDDTIMADLNPFGLYDQLDLSNEIELDNSIFYFSLFGACECYIYFDSNEPTFYKHLLGCLLSDDSSDIAIYFNDFFIQDSEEVTLNNEFVPNAYGPFTYEFRYEGELVYLDITNTEGDVAIFWATTLSNENFDESQFAIYPNPVANELYIESEQVQIKRVVIFTLNGKQVLDVNFQKDQLIDVSNLSKGLYLVKVETGNGSLMKKLIKE